LFKTIKKRGSGKIKYVPQLECALYHFNDNPKKWIKIETHFTEIGELVKRVAETCSKSPVLKGKSPYDALWTIDVKTRERVILSNMLPDFYKTPLSTLDIVDLIDSEDEDDKPDKLDKTTDLTIFEDQANTIVKKDDSLDFFDL
jgi:hypothetical protein